MATTSTPRLTALGVNRPSGEGLSAPAEPKRQSPLLSSPQEVDEGEKETTESGRPPLVRRRSVHVLHSSAFDQLLEVFQGNLDLLRVVAGRVGYNRIDVSDAVTTGTTFSSQTFPELASGGMLVKERGCACHV